MFNKVLLKLSMIVIAVMALSASPASASCGPEHVKEADVVAPAHTMEGAVSPEDHHEEMPEHHEE